MQEDTKIRKKAKNKIESVKQAEVLAEQQSFAEAEELERPLLQEAPKKKSRKRGSITNTILLAERKHVNCGECLQMVHVQFLECFCCMQPGFGMWRVCSECSDIVHPLRRVTRGCDACTKPSV